MRASVDSLAGCRSYGKGRLFKVHDRYEVAAKLRLAS
jgi:hypothetical protein